MLKAIFIAAVMLSVIANASAAPLDEVLAACGWSPDRIATLKQSKELSRQDESDLLQLASSLARFVDRLRKDARTETDDWVLRPVELEGVVNRINLDSSEEARVHCDFEHGVVTSEVLASRVPAAWISEGALPQPAELLALEIAPGRLLAIQWRWLPTDANYPHVNFGQSILGGLGVDIAALSRVRDGGPLRAEDSTPFYDVLSSMRKIGTHQLGRFAQGNLQRYAEQWEQADSDKARRALTAEVRSVTSEGRYPIAPLFNDAVRQRGELYLLEGLCRRCVAIETAAAAGSGQGVSGRYGVSRYYELEVFTPDSRNLPIVFCSLEVPEGFPQGDNLSVPVRVAGFFLKRWAYLTRQQTADGYDKAQLAPLLIGRAPIALVEPPGDSRWASLAVGGAFVLALGVVWWTVWRAARGDARFEQAARRRMAPPVDPAGLASLSDIDVDGTPRKDENQATER